MIACSAATRGGGYRCKVLSSQSACYLFMLSICITALMAPSEALIRRPSSYCSAPGTSLNSTVVTIRQGQLNGTTDVDLDGETFYKFLGIPYAKPPVDSLRFKAPLPPDSWSGVRDATTEGSACLARNRLSLTTLTGSEDCLYLNVYTKQLPQRDSRCKPVMVFIHGGAFTLGSGSQTTYGPQFLLTEDIVLVSLNYRLGILGFFSSDDQSLGTPGNAGLKDQVAALKWVKRNIAAFNGNPNDVTIFGISAGGASVSFQLLSRSSRGLFQKAIAQSGVAFNPWVWGSKNNSIQVAEYLGQTVTTERDALQVLMNATGAELVNASLQITDGIMNPSVRRPFGVVIETPNPTAFLTESPIKLLASGRYNQVPTIQGAVSSEGQIYEYDYMSPFVIESGFKVVPWDLNLEEDSDEYNNVTELINNFYFQDGYDKESIYEYLGDVDFYHGVVESTKLISKTSSQPIYMYEFSQEVGLSNLMRLLYGITEANVTGVAHGGDQMVLFKSSYLSLFGIQLTSANLAAVRQFVKLWADFARTGIPHPDWEPVTDPDDLKYFDIDTNSTLKSNLFPERITFWESVYGENNL